MRIDAHVHVWPRSARGELDGTIETAAATLATAFVDAAVLIQPSLLGLDHSYLAQATTGPLPAVAVAQAEPGDDDKSVAHLTELLARDGFSGFRLPVLRGGLEWFEVWWPTYAGVASAHDAVVCLLVTPDQLTAVRDAAGHAPTVQLVVDHLGRPDLASDPTAALADLWALAANPNVHAKVSAVPAIGREWSSEFLAETIRTTIDAFGPSRVLWGSDYPFTEEIGRYRDGPDVVRAALAGHDQTVCERVLGGNARRLFFKAALRP